MYTREYMNQDLGWVIPELAGAHPGDQLGPRRSALPVQHALGVWAIPVGDPITVIPDLQPVATQA